MWSLLYLWNYVVVYKVDRIDRMKPSGLFRCLFIRELVVFGTDIDIDIGLDIDIHRLPIAALQRFGSSNCSAATIWVFSSSANVRVTMVGFS
jgi:hypothetical protein